jgi:sulfide dehydrogenase cytochrome subunit
VNVLIRHLIPILGGLALSSAAWAASDVGVVLSMPCAGCHGSDGASTGEAPTIGGLSEAYLKATLVNYKNDARYGTVMNRIAKGYTEEELAAIAKYFAGKPWVSGEQVVLPDLAKQGQALHTSKGCIGCHGKNGVSTMPNVPRTAGQYIDYLVFQMTDYANPEVAIPRAAAPMRSMLKGLTEADLTALAHFYASQK